MKSGETKKGAAKRDAPVLPPSAKPPLLISVGDILVECDGAISLVEVTLHSLESQGIAGPEQEVLKRALTVIWSLHDWISETPSDDLHDEGDDEEGRP